MKHFMITSILTLTGLAAFILIHTGYLTKQNIVVDQEQEGLDQQIIIQFSHVVAENTPKGLAAQKFAEIVYEKTAGRVKVEVFPNGILYSDDKELQALKQGKVQMIAPSYSNMTELVPEWQVLDLPFLFQNYQHAETIFTGKIGEELLSYLDEEGMKGLAFWGNGFKQMTSSVSPLIEPEDFQNHTFRVMSSNVLKRQFQFLGAKTISTSFTDVYRTLENREVNGQENTISNIYSKGLYQFQQHLTLSNHGYLGYSVIINEDFWNSLSPPVQKLILEAIKETTKWNMEQSMNMNQTQLEEMKREANITIHPLPEASKERWIEAFRPLYHEVGIEVGEDLIEQIQEAAEPKNERN